MPTYCFVCWNCGNKATALRRIADRAKPVQCVFCSARMKRDYRAETQTIVPDPDACDADFDRYVELKLAGKEVERPVLSQCLGRVPGLRKHIGRDGKQYAVFRNRQHRERELKRMGLVDLDG